jgi:outer membrane protein OmpA-like peptidoglycan-associated protein
VRDDLLRLTMANDVSFDPNSAAVKPTFEPTLAKVAAVLARYPDSRITVVGHTDSTGFDDFNTLLSRDRALAVLEALTLGGVAADSLSAFGRGESKPRSSNRTADGRARNSRIEILLEPATA